MKPTLIVLAGPNGAGKSTLYQVRVAPFFAGPFINADLIQRDEIGDPSPQAAYAAAELAAGRRDQLIAAKRDFVTETVFSHPSKLDLITGAMQAGYDVVVMHVGVENADLSVARVKARITEGGHAVPEEKIRARFDRSAPIVREAVLIASLGMVFDNSHLNQPPRQVLLFRKGQLVKVDHPVPTWAMRIYQHARPS